MLDIIVYSKVNADNVSEQLGMAEYSYFFVLQDFLPSLEKLGAVQVAQDKNDILRLVTDSSELGNECIVLQFTAPHNMFLDIPAPSIPVFAWEFDTIPNQPWGNVGMNDWRVGLSTAGAAITHSECTVNAVKKEMGADYNVVSLPCPVWDDVQAMGARRREQGRLNELTLVFDGVVFDSRCMFVTEEMPPPPWQEWDGSEESVDEPPTTDEEQRETEIADVPVNAEDTPEQEGTEKEEADSDAVVSNAVYITGTLYTTLMNPHDHRKNWEDMLLAFCTVFKERSDVTLLIKISANHIVAFSNQVVGFLSSIPVFKCRLVLVMAYLSNDDFQKLVQATDFYVNTSYGEGQCIPLMEFLSAGVPAIAPATTALADYIDDDIAIVLSAHEEPTFWQHDIRQVKTAMRWRVDWRSLLAAFEKSDDLLHNNTDQYAAMETAAIKKLEAHCSRQVFQKNLDRFFDSLNI